MMEQLGKLILFAVISLELGEDLHAADLPMVYVKPQNATVPAGNPVVFSLMLSAVTNLSWFFCPSRPNSEKMFVYNSRVGKIAVGYSVNKTSKGQYDLIIHNASLANAGKYGAEFTNKNYVNVWLMVFELSDCSINITKVCPQPSTEQSKMTCTTAQFAGPVENLHQEHQELLTSRGGLDNRRPSVELLNYCILSFINSSRYHSLHNTCQYCSQNTTTSGNFDKGYLIILVVLMAVFLLINIILCVYFGLHSDACYACLSAVSFRVSTIAATDTTRHYKYTRSITRRIVGARGVGLKLI